MYFIHPEFFLLTQYNFVQKREIHIFHKVFNIST